MSDMFKAKSSLSNPRLERLMEVLATTRTNALDLHVDGEPAMRDIAQALGELRDWRRHVCDYKVVEGATEAPSNPDYVFGLNQVGSRIAFTNASKGFDAPSVENIDRKLLLAVSEICEAQDVLRDGHQPDEVFWTREGRPATSVGSVENGDKPDGFPIEIADAMIRLLHICNALNIDIAAAIALKLRYNRTRPEKHGRIF